MCLRTARISSLWSISSKKALMSRSKPNQNASISAELLIRLQSLTSRPITIGVWMKTESTDGSKYNLATIWQCDPIRLAHPVFFDHRPFCLFPPPERRWKITARRHAIPDFVKIILQVNLKIGNRLFVYPCCSFVRLYPFVRFPHNLFGNTKRLCFIQWLLPY